MRRPWATSHDLPAETVRSVHVMPKVEERTNSCSNPEPNHSICFNRKYHRPAPATCMQFSSTSHDNQFKFRNAIVVQMFGIYLIIGLINTNRLHLRRFGIPKPNFTSWTFRAPTESWMAACAPASYPQISRSFVLCMHTSLISAKFSFRMRLIVPQQRLQLQNAIRTMKGADEPRHHFAADSPDCNECCNVALTTSGGLVRGTRLFGAEVLLSESLTLN